MDETLPEGTRTRVEKRGDRIVRMRQHESSVYTYPTLELLANRGWKGAPRLITPGMIEELTFLPGKVPGRTNLPSWVAAPQALREVGRMIREFHDLTAGTSLVGDQETMCHNDLAPANTVYDPETLLPYAFIDWDLAAPGSRIADIGHAVWQWLELGPGAHIDTAAEGLVTLIDGYRYAYSVSEVIESAIQWRLDTATGIEQGAATDPTLATLVQAGVPADCREAAAWTIANIETLIVAARQVSISE